MVIYKDILGEKSKEVADLYNNMAIAVLRGPEVNPEKSLALFKKALDIYQKIFKEDNKDIADVYNSIASAHYLQNDHDRVLIMLQKSLDIRLKIFGRIVEKWLLYILIYIYCIKLKEMK